MAYHWPADTVYRELTLEVEERTCWQCQHPRTVCCHRQRRCLRQVEANIGIEQHVRREHERRARRRARRRPRPTPPQERRPPGRQDQEQPHHRLGRGETFIDGYSGDKAAGHTLAQCGFFGEVAQRPIFRKGDKKRSYHMAPRASVRD